MTPVEQKAADANLALSQIDRSKLQPALDEVSRETRVRERCFPRWVTEGRITATDATDRLARIQAAEEYLKILLDTVPEPVAPF